jgi:hypothetical protein
MEEVNVSETSANESQGNEVTTEVNETPTESSDSSAFLEGNNTETATAESENQSSESTGDSNDNDFSWEETPVSPSQETQSQESTSETPNVVEENQTTTKAELNYSEIASEFGFDNVNNKEDFESKIKEIQQEKERYKEMASDSLTNDTIKKLDGYLQMKNEDLVRADLELQGITGEKLDKSIRILKDNMTLDLESDKIRSNISRAISGEKEKIINSRKEADAKQMQDHENSIRELKSHLDKTETMFGFKMSKDPEGLQKVRDDHHQYITSGSFLKDITESNEAIAEAAWLWKHRDQLLKALTNKGKQTGRNEILSDLGNHEPSGQKRILNPNSGDGFNPGKFNG